MKIGIIVGSIRENRAGKGIGDWVLAQAKGREAEYELVDLKEFNVPLLDAPLSPGAANGRYENTSVQAWGNKIAEFDAYVFVTPEYNHTIPGAFKNAFDSLGVEWQKKAVAFVSYGFDGGIRATENWRVAVANFNMYDIRATVSLSLIADMGPDGFAPQERRAKELADLFDSLEPAAKAMTTLR